MTKNLITKPEVRKALIATGNVMPSRTETVRIHGNTLEERIRSQAAAIAARRKELGIKPIVLQSQQQRVINPIALNIAAARYLSDEYLDRSVPDAVVSNS